MTGAGVSGVGVALGSGLIGISGVADGAGTTGDGDGKVGDGIDVVVGDGDEVGIGDDGGGLTVGTGIGFIFVGC